MIKSILVNRRTDESFKSKLKMEHADLIAEMQVVENLPTHERLQLARLRRAQQLKVAHQKEKEWLKSQRAKGVSSTILNGFTVDTQHHFRNTQEVTNKNNKCHISFENSVILLEAASRNDIQEVAELLQRGITPDVANEDGLTALHQCCIDNNIEMLKLLLNFGANVNAQDSDKWTPLHAAATCGHFELVRVLINYGANLLAVNTDGNMPYDLCDDEATLDYIEAEMSKRGVTQELIDETRSATERRMLNDLVEHSRNGGDLEQPDEHGATPLHIAAANGYIKVVEFLLEMHVNVDVLDKDKWSPVHAAACWGHLEVLELLAKYGADLNSKNKDDETAIDICEDPEIRERIEQLKNEQENKRLAEAQRRRVRRSQSNNTRAQSVRRTSLRDKTLTTKKDAVEETRLRLQAQEIFTTTPKADGLEADKSNWLHRASCLPHISVPQITLCNSNHNNNNNSILRKNHNPEQNQSISPDNSYIKGNQNQSDSDLLDGSHQKNSYITSSKSKSIDRNLMHSMSTNNINTTNSSPTNEAAEMIPNISQEAANSKINVQVTVLVDASNIPGHHHHSIQLQEQILQHKQRCSSNNTNTSSTHEIPQKQEKEQQQQEEQQQEQQQPILVNATTLANLKKQRSLTRTTDFWKNYSNDSFLDTAAVNNINNSINCDNANNNNHMAYKAKHSIANKNVLLTKDQLQQQSTNTIYNIVSNAGYYDKTIEDNGTATCKQSHSMLELGVNKFSGKTSDIISDNSNSRKCCTVM